MERQKAFKLFGNFRYCGAIATKRNESIAYQYLLLLRGLEKFVFINHGHQHNRQYTIGKEHFQSFSVQRVYHEIQEFAKGITQKTTCFQQRLLSNVARVFEDNTIQLIFSTTRGRKIPLRKQLLNPFIPNAPEIQPIRKNYTSSRKSVYFRLESTLLEKDIY